MARDPAIDAVLVQWGDRLFYPGNRIVRDSTPRLKQRPESLAKRSDAIRARIDATFVRRAPQVMVKVTGGGSGMKAIAAHFRYISKGGRLVIEDQDGTELKGSGAVAEIAEEWRVSGSRIEDVGPRREAFNIMLSMPRGKAEPHLVLRAARDFAKKELAGHKYVMVLHDHQANPHVHLSVRAEGIDGRRLNPRKADLHRWRETFAEQLRQWGVEAEATRQGTRGVSRRYDALWQQKARAEGRLTRETRGPKSGDSAQRTLRESHEAWSTVAAALRRSADPGDQRLARGVQAHLESLARQGAQRQTPPRGMSREGR
ncbi:conjugal transfer protein TraS [Rubrivivax gelatinosus]|uniref:Conjugal transfer protein TraS n=1 Tax=Rubrivivax gelatinosus TaxID=28068 RepID=A0ABS1DPM4_RUBGE|nr:conjugal transfer protein TraS [Rubrivivax gelatinosus]MBK1611863.1 conjugal transfer protein TraS [Rubrivivax gelatinosus]MBK1711520.1 conjugal transfer protein TraS [Rubrivivax gelatinosus]